MIHDGLLDFETGYDLEWGDVHRFNMTAGRLAVDQLSVGPRGGSADTPVKLPRIEVTGIDTDVVGKDAKVAEAAFRGGTLRVRVEPGGGLELMRMMPPPSEGSWRWSVGAVTIQGATMNVEDLSTPRPVALSLTDVKVRLEQLREGAGDLVPAVGLGHLGRDGAALPGRPDPAARRRGDAPDRRGRPRPPAHRAIPRGRREGAARRGTRRREGEGHVRPRRDAAPLDLRRRRPDGRALRRGGRERRAAPLARPRAAHRHRLGVAAAPRVGAAGPARRAAHEGLRLGGRRDQHRPGARHPARPGEGGGSEGAARPPRPSGPRAGRRRSGSVQVRARPRDLHRPLGDPDGDRQRHRRRREGDEPLLRPEGPLHPRRGAPGRGGIAHQDQRHAQSAAAGRVHRRHGRVEGRRPLAARALRGQAPRLRDPEGEARPRPPLQGREPDPRRGQRRDAEPVHARGGHQQPGRDEGADPAGPRAPAGPERRDPARRADRGEGSTTPSSGSGR